MNPVYGVDALDSVLNDPVDIVRAVGSNALGNIPVEKAVESLKKALSDPYGYVRYYAILGLSRIYNYEVTRSVNIDRD